MANPRKPSPQKSVRSGKSVASLADQASLGQALLQSTGAGIYIVQDGKFVYVSPFFESLSGYAAKKLLGQDSLTLVHPDDRETVRKTATINLKHRRVASPYEYRFLKKNGEFMWVMERISSIEYKGQRAVLGSFMDIQQRKELEEAVAASAQMHSTILSQMHDACFEVDLAGNFGFINNSMCRGLHYKIGELKGKNYRVIVPEEDQKTVLQAFSQVLKSGKTNAGYAHRVKRKDGIILQVESTISMVRDMGGNAAGCICVSRDVTESKRLEAALFRSEEIYRGILEQMQDSYYHVDLAGKFIFINDSTCRNLGYKKGELDGKSYGIIMTKEDKKYVYDVFHRVFLTGEPDKGFAHMVIRKDGTTGYAESSVSLLRDEKGNPVGFTCVGRDVTERRQLEQAVRKSEERYRTILEQMYDSYYEVDLAGNFTFVNDSVCRNLLYTREELLGKNFNFSVPPDEVKNMFLAFNEVFRTGQPNKTFPHRILRSDGKTLYSETTIELRRDDTGQPIGFRSISRDVTERTKAELALKQSEERYRALYDSSLELVYIHDFEGKMLDANRATLELLGYSREDIPSLNFASLLDPEDLPRAVEALKGDDRPGSGREMREFKLRRKDGSYVFIETQASRIRRDGKPYAIQGIARDISERKMFEQRLSEMATHDFLTGLPNRVLLNDRFTMALAQAHRNKHRLAIIAIDLDRFKSVNDTLGHQAGDELLKAIAKRLKNLVRSSDTVARMGGDEFLLLMPELHMTGDAIKIIDKIAAAFKEPFIIEGSRLNMSASMGLATYPEDGEDMDALMRKSDASMYNIKHHGPSEGRPRHIQEET